MRRQDTSNESRRSPFGSRQLRPAAARSDGVWGLDWLNDLVKAGHAIDLGGTGYPLRFTATAARIVPRLAGEPPYAHHVWIREVGDTVNEKWAGRTVIDGAVVAACHPDEWLLIETWDES